jgi:hypothetical protein
MYGFGATRTGSDRRPVSLPGSGLKYPVGACLDVAPGERVSGAGIFLA